MFNTKKKSRKHTGCRFLTEEMILREGIEDAKALRRGQHIFVGPVSTNSISSMKMELPETKYEYTAEPVNDAKTLFSVKLRRRTWSEERYAKKHPPRMETCRIICAAELETSNW